jgi:hypothetical protein
MIPAAPQAAKKIKLDTQHDETFNFAGLKTWAWHPTGTGEVKLALTSTSDPAKVKALVDPIIVAAVEKEMAARGFSKVADKADLYITYWMLGTIGDSAQVMGQFLPATTEWAVPPFMASTQAMRTYPVGTLLLDILQSNGKDMVWRGSARTEVDLDLKPAERQKRLQGAIHDLLQKFPPKKK